MTIYYLTKHCLADGIVEVDTDTDELAGTFRTEPRTTLSSTGRDIFHYRKPDHWATYRYQVGKDAYERREDAVADANKRRDRQLASLRKQIAKLEALNF